VSQQMFPKGDLGRGTKRVGATEDSGLFGKIRIGTNNRANSSNVKRRGSKQERLSESLNFRLMREKKIHSKKKEKVPESLPVGIVAEKRKLNGKKGLLKTQRGSRKREGG